jgi:hypothetical protein
MIPSPWSKSGKPCSKDFDKIIVEGNSKFQIPNIKQITMTKIPNSKTVLVIETGDPPRGWGVRRTNIGI